MENLSISDQPPAPPAQGGQPQMQQGPPPVPQLPPQMFITAASLLDLTDKKLMVVLRDGRKLIGVLRSWDQFANLVLQGTTERTFVPLITVDPQSSSEGQVDASPAPSSRGLYADEARGLFVVRGENVLLLGEIDLDKDDDPPPGYEKAELEVVRRMATERKAAEKTKNKKLLKGLAAFGFEGENSGEIVY